MQRPPPKSDCAHQSFISLPLRLLSPGEEGLRRIMYYIPLNKWKRDQELGVTSLKPTRARSRDIHEPQSIRSHYLADCENKRNGSQGKKKEAASPRNFKVGQRKNGRARLGRQLSIMELASRAEN